jgi:hypothetical protein
MRLQSIESVHPLARGEARGQRHPDTPRYPSPRVQDGKQDVLVQDQV